MGPWGGVGVLIVWRVVEVCGTLWRFNQKPEFGLLSPKPNPPPPPHLLYPRVRPTTQNFRLPKAGVTISGGGGGGCNKWAVSFSLQTFRLQFLSWWYGISRHGRH